MSLRQRRIAVVGASGQVGRMLLKLLAERGVPTSKVTGVASSRSNGHKISYGDDDSLTLSVVNENIDWSVFDTVFFAAGSKVSSEWAPRAVKAGCFVVDKSSHFRMNEDVPLVIPEVNAHLIPLGKPGLVSNPNCVVLPLMVVLHALQKYGGMTVSSVSVSTYQSVSGKGHDGMQALDRETGKHHIDMLMHSQGMDRALSNTFERPIAFNVIPKIGDLNPATGFADEETKIIDESHKILGVDVCVTCVRVPVFIGHCMALHITCKEPVVLENARSALEKETSIMLDEPHNYSTPIDCAGFDDIHVSRLRGDGLSPNGLMLWIACDNLRKGAALNAVQIAEYQSQGGVRGACAINS